MLRVVQTDRMGIRDKLKVAGEQAVTIRAERADRKGVEKAAETARNAALQEEKAARVEWLRQSGEMREYEVVELEGTAFTGSAPSRRLRRLLNEKARDGWRVWQVLNTNLSGPVRQGISGLVVIFERPVPPTSTPGELVEDGDE